MPRGAIDSEAACMPTTVKAHWIVALERHLDWDDLPRRDRLFNAVLRALHGHVHRQSGDGAAAADQAMRNGLHARHAG